MILSLLVFLAAAFGVGLVVRDSRRARVRARWEVERMEAEAMLARAEVRATVAAIQACVTERIDVLEVWWRLPATVPPHERPVA